MAAIGECDQCGNRAPLRANGIKYYLPGGWEVIVDGPPKTRSVCIMTCGTSCTTQKLTTLPPSLRLRCHVKVSEAPREAPANVPKDVCQTCFYLDAGEECWEHGLDHRK